MTGLAMPSERSAPVEATPRTLGLAGGLSANLLNMIGIGPAPVKPSDLANRTMADGCVPDRVAMTLNGWSAMSSG